MKILFMCAANSARSQLADVIAGELFKGKAEIASAGSNPSKVNPFAVRALAELKIDISNNRSKSVADLPPDFVDKLDYVITLCAEEVCPVIISKAKKLHWPLPDPAGKEGDDAQQLARFRDTRDEIKNRLESFGKEIGLVA